MPQTTPLLMRHRSAAILAMLAGLGCAHGRQQKAQTAAVCPTENDELVADAPPYPTYLAEVRLSPEAREQLRGATAVLRIMLDKDGLPIECSLRVLRSTDTRLSTAARNALLASRFTPATLHGRPVPTWIDQPFEVH